MHLAASTAPAAAQGTQAALCDASGAQQFNDVAPTDYAAAYILCAKALRLSQGNRDGTFNADGNLTRAQMAAFLIRLWLGPFQQECPKGHQHPFTDIPAGYWAGPHVSCLHALGITKGTSPTTYTPDAPLTTAAFTLFTARLLNEHTPATCSPTTASSSELLHAAACLTLLNIAPDIEEASAHTPASRAQMAVYLIGAWHHATGRGQPPQPPKRTPPPATQPGGGWGGVPKQPGGLLAEVQDRGELRCGVSGAAVAFSETDARGDVSGFDADYCRVVAAAILGDAEAVRFVALTAAERFIALAVGGVDLLMRNSTWTQSRDADWGLDFGPTTYYDGQQLMGRVSDGFTNSSQVADLDGLVVCANAGTTTERNIADVAEAAGIGITLQTYVDFNVVMSMFASGRCDVVTTDGSALAGRKTRTQPDGQEWVIFPSVPISREPLGPVYRQNDSVFADAVNWAVYATIIAEEKGITQANVDAMRDNPPDAEAGRLLGGIGEQQTGMSLSADAFYQVISQVGNYGEIYERHLAPAGLTRSGSPNASWREGGLIYAPPAR